MNKSKLFLFGLLFTMVLSFTLISLPSFSNHLFTETMRLYEMNRCFADGQIPCRWVPDMGGIYGYPLFQYYGPLPYYFGEVIYLLSGSLLFALRIIFAVAFGTGYCFVYLLAKKFADRKKRVLSALVYVLSMTGLSALFLTGSLGEIWSLMIFPALIWGSLRISQYTKAISCLPAILFFTIFILSHIISATIALPVILALSLFIFLQKGSLKFLKLSALSLVVSLMVAAFYWVPLMLEKNLVHAGKNPFGYFTSLEKGGFDYLPVYAEKPPVRPAASPFQVLAGESEMLSYQSGTNWISFKTDTKVHSIIRLSQFYFPNWRVLVDGEDVKVDYKNNNLGLITLLLGPGIHNVYMKLEDTPIRTLSNLITIFGVTFYLIFALLQIQRVRKWLSYYLKGLYR